MSDTDFGLSNNAVQIFKNLYSFQEETIDQTFQRVARDFVTNEEEYDTAYNLLARGIWRPNTPAFLNAGTSHKVFSACYVTGLEDSMDSIYNAANIARKVFQYGSGLGIPVGNLRERDAYIYEGDKSVPPEGRSSGPITFMKLYDAVGETTKSGGRVRRAAILCAIPVWHPDVMDFIKCKEEDGRLANMNISVAVTDDFMKALEDNITFDLHSPSDGSKTGEISAKELWDALSYMNWKSADPGILFVDNINKFNPLISEIMINCTNPSLRKGTRLLTNKGIYEIQELENKTFNLPTITNNSAKAICRLSGKNKELYKITLVGNRYYYATGDHKWPVVEDYEKNIIKKIKTSELEKGDILLKDNRSILPYGSKGNYKDGFLMGWVIGDGWITNRKDNGKRQLGIIISKEDAENGIKELIIEKLKLITNRYYNPTLKNNNIEVNTSCKEIEEYMVNFSYQSKKDGLPEFVWKESSEEFRKGLVDGLFSSDGYVSDNGYVVLRSSKIKLINDVSDLLGFYGIKTLISKQETKNINFPNKKNYNKSYTIYSLVLPRHETETFKKIFKLTHIRKQLKLDNFIHNKRKLVKTNYIKIKSVEKTDIKEDVWDISVFDNSHTFRLPLVFTGNCGEQPLIPFGCCNLSAINVHTFVDNGEMDWTGLYNTAAEVTTLMDNAIDVMEYPDERFKDTAYKYRQIGIGPMGLSDAMYELDIKYDSAKGKEFAGEVMKVITCGSIDRSADLAEERGRFHNYNTFREDTERVIEGLCDGDTELMKKVKTKGLRHSAHSTAMPTGTVAISCDASYGIEPCFGLVFKKNLIDGSTMMFVNKVFEEKFKNEDWYTDDLLDKIFHNGGSLKGIRGIPDDVRKVFVVAHDIKAKERIDVQASLQKHCSSAISSTVNLPGNTTKDEISDLYKYAYEKGLKGITTYRDGCKQNQPVTFKPEKTEDNKGFIRPTRLAADVFKVDTGNGALYITIGSNNGKPVELFLSIGKSGQILNTLSEALGRVISIALQGGVPVENVVKTLIGVNSDRPVWTRLDDKDEKPTQVLSIPDGIAQLLDKYYAEGNFNGASVETEKCPMCGLPIMMIEGCASCVCGWSRCS